LTTAKEIRIHDGVVNQDGALRVTLTAFDRAPRWIKLEGRVLYDAQDLVEHIDRGRRIPSVRAYLEEHDGA
jgi:hypothetical protein